MDEKYTVYVRVNNEQIVGVNSSAFLQNSEGWTAIDAGVGDRYLHAQGNYLQKPLFDSRGCANYKLDGTTPVERSEKEKEEELAARPEPKPSSPGVTWDALAAAYSEGVASV